MATEPLDDDTLAAIVDADRDSMSDDDLTTEDRAHCAHSLRLGEVLQQERAAHARTRAELAAARERLAQAGSSPPSPGLVEAARNLLAEVAPAYRDPDASTVPNDAVAALRAALPNEPTG
jgi:hypothetical protein